MKYTLLFIFLLAGCSQHTTYSNNSNINEHMIKSQKLSILMKELNLVTSGQYKSELEKDDTRRRYALTLANTLKKLSSNIKNMSKKELGNPSSEDYKLYQKYASKLNNDANNIEYIASSYQLEKLPFAIESMNSTCRDCHSKLRY